MVGRNSKQICHQIRLMPNSCLGLAPDYFCSRSVKLKEKCHFWRGSREAILCVDTQTKPKNCTDTTGGFECELLSAEVSLQLCTPTSSCNLHRGGGTSPREVRTLLTLRQLEVSSGKWDILNSLTNSWSQVHPEAPTSGRAITLWGKSTSGTGSRQQHTGPVPCLQDHPHCSPSSLPRPLDPQRGEKRCQDTEDKGTGGGRRWKETALASKSC